MSEEGTTASENSQYPTCFQSRRASSNAPPPKRRRRSKPKSMMRSRTVSVTSKTIIVALLLSTSGKLQEPVYSAGTHIEWICG